MQIVRYLNLEWRNKCPSTPSKHTGMCTGWVWTHTSMCTGWVWTHKVHLLCVETVRVHDTDQPITKVKLSKQGPGGES